ncbi:holo-ACP synthase [Thalassobacillus devorans]|uniref:holo-ACP synthase n=1 Tax=Thalassobacillus devorans TaxID=279813 RepID=UPI00049200D8|nr:holo-ACP synthase [Thalassobacillus devorans]
MIKGIGIDLIELERINKIIMRNDRFVQRILTEKEQLELASYKHEARRIEFIAGRFAAKEAVGKALGTGIGKVSFQDIEISRTDQGAPQISVSGYEHLHIWLSISHSRDHAIAQVVLEE